MIENLMYSSMTKHIMMDETINLISLKKSNTKKMKRLFVYSFYRFKNLNKLEDLKIAINKSFEKKSIKGTVLLAKEGINGSLAGTKLELDDCLKFLRSCLKIRKLEVKVNKIDLIPFNRLRIRIKKEIVSLGQGKINVNKYKGKLVSAEDWDDFITNSDIKVIDVRNEFEINIGKFKNSQNPKTKSFREFPNSLKKMKVKKNDKIAMYCTGGIRCEKASAYLKLKGYKKVYQLQGGIIKYLEYTKHKKSLWKGECFVFDDRVTIDKKLLRGKYLQCYGCRHPITYKEIKSKNYKKGVHCPHCYNKRTTKQVMRSEARQLQIRLDKEKGNFNIYSKMKY